MVNYRIDYYNKDFDAIKANIIAKIKADPRLKDKWTDFSEQDLGVIMIEVFSGIADMLSFNMDNQVRECYLDTAYRRENVARLARTLGYSIEPKQSGMTKVSIALDNIQATNMTIPKYHKFTTSGGTVITYLSNEPFVIPANQSCVFDVLNQPSTGGKIDTSTTDKIRLIGVNIYLNTDNAKLYALVENDGSKNIITLFRQEPTQATNDDIVAQSIRNVDQPIQITGVTLDNPTGIDSSFDLAFIYNGGSGMTLAWDGGVPIVVDAGGTFTLTDTLGNTVDASIVPGSLPIANEADFGLNVTTIATPDNVYKVAYGDDVATPLTVVLTDLNGSGLTGEIDLTTDFNISLYSDIQLHIDGPASFEGTITTDTFVSDGSTNQIFETTSQIQQIPSMATKTLELTVNGSLWEEVEDLFLLNEDKFKVRTIADTYSEIIFGDGISGSIPDPGTIIVKYVIGNGADGSVGSNKIKLGDQVVDGAASSTIQVNNIESSTDATNAESIESAKANAIGAFQSRGRAVTANDYEYLIGQYIESDMLNPRLVQAYKDETEADLVNELFIFVLSIDPDTGKYIPVNIDLTETGGLYEYVDSVKAIPEGIRTITGVNGINNGTTVDVTLYWNVYLQGGYETEVETVRGNIAEAIKYYFHNLEFQQSVTISELYNTTMQVEGVKSVGIYTDPVTQDSTTAAYDLTLDGDVNKGKVYTLPDVFYNNIKSRIKFSTEANYA